MRVCVCLCASKVAWWDWPHERLDALVNTGLLGSHDVGAFLSAAEAILASEKNSASAERDLAQLRLSSE